jgi:hypothetical protein
MEADKEETRGRPAHEPTDEKRKLVHTLSGIGLTHEQIAVKLDISPPTLRLYYSKELELGKAEAIAGIAQSLYQKAKSGDKACMFFYLKTQGRWKENHDDTNQNGEKVVVIRGGFPPDA